MIDGADEFDPSFQLITGGAALLREKIVAQASNKMVVADDRKQVTTLGQFPLPID